MEQFVEIPIRWQDRIDICLFALPFRWKRIYSEKVIFFKNRYSLQFFPRQNQQINGNYSGSILLVSWVKLFLKIPPDCGLRQSDSVLFLQHYIKLWNITWCQHQIFNNSTNSKHPWTIIETIKCAQADKKLQLKNDYVDNTKLNKL